MESLHCLLELDDIYPPGNLHIPYQPALLSRLFSFLPGGICQFPGGSFFPIFSHYTGIFLETGRREHLGAWQEIPENTGLGPAWSSPFRMLEIQIP